MNGRRIAPALLIAILAALPLLPPLCRGEILTLRDHSDYFVPMRFFTAETILGGQLPLWNPYNGAGERWLANPQTAVFYPPAWLFLILPLPAAYVLFLAIHLALLAAGSYRLFRMWSGGLPAAFGAIGAALCGSTMSLLDVGNNLASLAWLPWVVLAALTLDADKRGDASPLLLTLCFLGGEPLIALFAAVMWSAVIVARFKASAPFRIAGAAVLTVGLSAIQLIPFLEYLIGTDRASGLDPRLAFSQTASLRDWSSVVLAPWAFAGGGLPTLAQSFVPSMYAGVPIVLMAATAVLSIGRLRRQNRSAGTAAIWLMVIAAAALIFSTAPQWEWARSLIVSLHLNVSRYPARLIPVGVIALCGLAAVGIDQLSSARASSRFGAGAILIALLAAFGVATSAPAGPQWRPIAGFVVIALWLAAVGFAPGLFSNRRVLAAAALALALDLYASARPFLQSGAFERRSSPYASLIPSDRRFARLPPRTLLFDRASWLAGYRNLLERKFDLSSPAPAIPTRYLALHDAALYGPRFDLLRFLSVEYLITDRHLDLPPIATANGAVLRKLPPAMPFAVAWPDVQAKTSEGKERSRTIGASVDAALMKSRPLEPWSATSRSTIPVAPYFSASGVTIRTSASSPTVLTLNQLDARGWSVSIDGVPATSLRAHRIFRAVRVPAGEHLVEWRYRPWSFYVGAILSLTTLIILLARNAQHMRGLRLKNSSFHPPSL